MQLNIEERKYKAESEWEEGKVGTLEQELTMKFRFQTQLPAQRSWLMQNVMQKAYYLCRKIQGPLPAASHWN